MVVRKHFFRIGVKIVLEVELIIETKIVGSGVGYAFLEFVSARLRLSRYSLDFCDCQI